MNRFVGEFNFRLDIFEERGLNLIKSIFKILTNDIKSYIQGRETLQLSEKEDIKTGYGSFKISQIYTFSYGPKTLIEGKFFIESHKHSVFNLDCYTSHTCHYIDNIISKFISKMKVLSASIYELGSITRTKVLDLLQMENTYFEISNFDWNPYTGLLTGNLSGGPNKLTKYKIVSIGVQ